MTASAQVQAAAQALREARATRKAIPRVSETHGIQSLDDAYAIASLNVAHRQSAGARIVGKKVGLTSIAVQRQLGVDQPDFGILFDDMEFLTASEIPASTLLQPKVEAEVAFVVGSDLAKEPPSWGEFLRAIAYALPAIEIVDSAIADWKITLIDTVADNASAALYVLGDQPVDVGSLQLAQVEMTMDCGGKTVSEGRGEFCLGHPLRAAWWLARTMASRGAPMRAGEVIMSGALGPMVPVHAGQEVTARLSSLGTVSCRMV